MAIARDLNSLELWVKARRRALVNGCESQTTPQRDPATPAPHASNTAQTPETPPTAPTPHPTPRSTPQHP